MSPSPSLSLSSSSSSSLLCRLLLSLLFLSSFLLSPLSAQSPVCASVTPLTSSQYIVGAQLNPYSYDCYSITVPSSSNAELRLSMTSFAGDAELFVSTSLQPSNMSYTWRGYDAGTSSIVIGRDDPNWCRAPTCTYYISAYSHEYYAVYDVVATTMGADSPIRAFRNNPVNTLTPRNSRQLFYYLPRNFEALHGIRFTTTPSYGAAIIFVSVSGNMADMNNTAAYPTNTSYTWVSRAAFAGAFLHVWHTDPGFRSLCNQTGKGDSDYTGCVYLISVYQIFGHSTQYTLLVTQNTPVEQLPNPLEREQDQHISLVNHVPFIRTVWANEHEYYVAHQLEEGSEFYVSMTPLSGECSFLVTKSPNTDYPNENTTAEALAFNSATAGTLTYSYVVRRTGGVFSAFVYIGVRAYYNCTYTITANVYPPTRVGRFPARLTDGVPQYDSLHQYVRPEEQTDPELNSWRYYVYYLPEPDALTLSVTRFVGDVEIYISGDLWSRNNTAYVDFAPPNMTNYDFAITDHGLTTINWKAAPAGRYVIGVHASALADYAITVTATFTEQILINNAPTPGYIRPVYNATYDFWVNTAQYVFVVDNVNASYPVPINIAITQLSGHVRVFVSDTNPGWYINGSDPSTYNWTQSGQRLESIVIPPSLIRRGVYWVKVYAWEDSTYTITAGYASFTVLQPGVPQDNWIPPHTSQYYAITVPGQPDPVGPPAVNHLVTLVPLAGRASMVYNRLNLANVVLPDHRNESTFNVYERGNYYGFVWHEMELFNYFCTDTRCTYIIEVYTYQEGARYNLMAFSLDPTNTNNQSSILQHTVPQLARSVPMRGGGGGMGGVKETRFIFHVPSDNATATLAFTPQGAFLNQPGPPQPIVISVHRCEYPHGLERWEWVRFVDRGELVLVIRPEDPVFRQPAACPRFTPFGLAGAYHVTVSNYGEATVDYTLALSVFDPLSRYTNESSLILVNEMPQVGLAEYPARAFFRMFPVLPSQQIHLGLPDHSVLYHSVRQPYPNATTADDIKDSRLDVEWLQWPLTSNDTWHYFSVESGEGLFYLTPKVYNGTNDTSVITELQPGVATQGRAFPGYWTYYQFFVYEPNVTFIQLNMEVLSGNPHLYLNYAPFNAPNSYRISNVTFPSRDNNWMNATNPNFPVLRLESPPAGHYLLSIVPANMSRAQADWKVTLKRGFTRYVDYTILHDGVKASDWLWHNTSNYHVIRIPAYPRGTYNEVRVSLTSWYGDAELFVSTSRAAFPPDYNHFLWRGYDAGTASLVINSSDPDWCEQCDLIINVFSNEVSSYYSIVATLYGNSSYIPLTNHLPINHRTPVNSTQRFYYRPYNYELHHGFRIHLSPAYGAATFAIRAVRVNDYVGLPWPFPDGNMSSTAQWTSYGWFEGSAVHVKHTDPGFCTEHGGDVNVQDERSNCLYLISVTEPTGFVETQYTLLLQAVVTPDMLPKEGPMYDPVQEPHNRLVNHIALQQFGEQGNVTYYKTTTVNPNSTLYVSLTVLSGWADLYVDYRTIYPNSTGALWNSMTRNTTAFSFYVDLNGAFTELFLAVECHINTSYTIVAGQYSQERLGRFPSRLTNGVPQFDTLAAVRYQPGMYPPYDSGLYRWRYFVYYLPVADDLVFSIQKFVGEVEAYIAYDPLLSANNGTYSQFRVPTDRDTLSYDHAMDKHGIDTYALNAAKPGRYVIGVHAYELADYQISVTAHFTHQVLVKDVPTAGSIQVYRAGPDDVRDAARFVMYYPAVYDRNLSIIMTTLSGFAHLFVSDSNWNIDPRNASSYRWAARDHPYQIDIALADLKQGPYYVYVQAFQNTTFSLLASEFYFTGIQLGLPQTVGARNNTGHVYALVLPGQERAENVFVQVVPLLGRAWLYGVNVSAGFVYPNHSDPSTYTYSADYLYSKPQVLAIPNQRCVNKERCTYLIEVHCPVDCFYTLNAYPYNGARISQPALIIEQHVPQYAFLAPATDDSNNSPIGRFEFRIPDDDSIAVLTFTPQWTSRYDTSVDWTNLDVTVVVDQFNFATEVDGPGPCWRTTLQQYPAIVISNIDECIRRPRNNRTMAGPYYVSVFNQGANWIEYTMTLALYDDSYSDAKGVVLVDTVQQIGINGPDPRLQRPGEFPLSFNAYYRMYHRNLSHQIHIKFWDNVELIHSNASGMVYPTFDCSESGRCDRLSSLEEVEWLEYPISEGAHYFNMYTSSSVPKFNLLPYIADGQNATNVRQTLHIGETRVGRLEANHTTYFSLLLFSNTTQRLRISVEPIYGEPLAFVSFGNFIPGSPYSDAVFPFVDYNIANITDTSFPNLYLQNPQPGEYLIAVHAYHTAPASFRITALVDDAPRQLWPNEVVEGAQLNGTVQWYTFDVPVERQRDPNHIIKVALTSWYGEAEFFVALGYEAANTSRFDWRTYDAGSSAVLIDEHGEDRCERGVCRYFVAVYANEIAAYYSLVVSFGEPTLLQLTNHVPLNYIVRAVPQQYPPPPSSHASVAQPPPQPPAPQPDVAYFSFRPTNAQLKHGIHIHTYPAFGAAPFAVLSATGGSEFAGWVFPVTNATWRSEGYFSGSWLHIRTTDYGFCTSTRSNWTGETGPSDCIYIIAVYSNQTVDSQFSILVSTFVTEAELPYNAVVGSPAFNDVAPHIRMLNNVPIFQYQPNGTWLWFKLNTNQLNTETVLSLTTIAGWADFAVSGTYAFPNFTAPYHFFNTRAANVSTLQFRVDQQYAYNELFVGVRAWTNVTYTLTMSQFPIQRLGRFPIRLTNGVPQVDTLAEYDQGPMTWELSHERYFVYYLVYPGASLTVTLTKYMGETELYLLQQPLYINGRRQYNANYTEYPLPSAMLNNHSITDHALDVYTMQQAPPGRYVFLVRARNRADYAIDVTETDTYQVLLKDVPTPGAIRPFMREPERGSRDRRAYVMNYTLYAVGIPDVYTRDLIIDVTELSGHVGVWVGLTPFINPRDPSTWLYSATESVRLEPILIPNAQLQKNAIYFIVVEAVNNATFTVLATDYYYAQLELGVPTNAWLRAGDSHVYGITVPGNYSAHDLIVSVVPLVGRAYLFGTNITAAWKYPMFPDNSTVDFVTQNPWDAIDGLYINNSQCRAWRCTYLIQVYCSDLHADYCRYNLNAIPWTTFNVGNTTVTLQDSVPQVGFSGLDLVNRTYQNLTFTHYKFYVPQQYTNVSVQLTGRQTGYADFPPYLFVSRWQFISEANGFHYEWMSGFSNYTGEQRLNPSVYFDWTSPVYQTPGPMGYTQSSHYYLSVLTLYPEVYTLTLNLVDDYNRHDNRSAIIIPDSTRQAGRLYPEQHRTLYTFVAPRVNSTKRQVTKAVTFQVQTEGDFPPPNLFVTADTTVPGPSNSIYNLTWDTADRTITILPGYPRSCDTRVQDCFYNVAAYHAEFDTPTGRYVVPEHRYILTASNGQAFDEINDGEEVVAQARLGDPRQYRYELFPRGDEDNYDLTVTVIPSRLFCNAVAYIDKNRVPNPLDDHTPRTNYTQGVRTVHLRRATPGTYLIVVYADSIDSDCRFQMTVTSDLIQLRDGEPFADTLRGVNESYSRNESWRWYRFGGVPPWERVVIQVSPLSSDTRVNFYVKYEERGNPNTPWLWNSTWNATTGLSDSLVILPTDPLHRNDSIGFFIAVECLSFFRDCAYELTAETGFGIRRLEDGRQIVYPLELAQDEWAYFRAYAEPSRTFLDPLTITVGRLFGGLSMYATLDPRNPRPGPVVGFQYQAKMDDYFGAAAIIVPFDDLVKAEAANGYINIAVRGDGPGKSAFTISSSLIATYLNDGVETLGWCDANRDALFIFNLDEVHPVQLELTALLSRSNASSIRLYVDDRNNYTSGDSHLWSWERWEYNSSLFISQRDPRLRTCVGTRGGCTLFINVTGCAEFTVFNMVASVGDTPTILNDNTFDDAFLDNGPPPVYDFGTKTYMIGVSQPTSVGVVVESCHGTIASYMNRPGAGEFPTNTSYELVPSGEQLQVFSLGTRDLVPNSFYLLTVEARDPYRSHFRVFTTTRSSNYSAPVLALPSSFQATAGDHAVTVQFDNRVTATQPVLFRLYAVPDPERNDASLGTRCGTTENANVSLVVEWTEAQVKAAAPAGSTRTNVAVDNGKFTNGVLYRLGLQVVYRDAPDTGAYTSYGPLPEVTPVAPASPSESKVAEDAGAIILGVVLPITLVLAGIALYLYIRNKKLQQELSVELPDVSATPSSAAARRRAQRGPDVGQGGDAFSRGGGDMYNSLLGEEENGGADEAGRKGRSRAGRKPATSNGGAARATSDLPEDSDVAYRSDVI